MLAARMLASACAAEGKYVASFPMYGFERRGMPVVAFTRFDDEPIREKTQIYTPDCLVVIDPTLLGIKTLFDGLKPDGVLVLNSPKAFTEPPHPNLKKAGDHQRHPGGSVRDRPGYPQHLPHRRAGQGHRLGQAGVGTAGSGRLPRRRHAQEEHPQRRARLRGSAR